MKKLQLLALFLLSFVLLCDYVAAKQKLTENERQAGLASIGRFREHLAKADDEDKRLFELLTKDRKFFTIWSRSIADKDNMDKLKSLIKASRKKKLWGNIEWMLDTLSDYENQSAAYYRLKALCLYEQGRREEAVTAAQEGVYRDHRDRRARRVWYKLHCQHKWPKPRPEISSMEDYALLVDLEQCHTRSELLGRLINDSYWQDEVPEVATKTTSSELMVAVFQDYFDDKGDLPATFHRDHNCPYVCGTQKGSEILRVTCRMHFCSGTRLKKNGKPILVGKHYEYKVLPQVIDTALEHEEGRYRQMAAEYLLLQPGKLSIDDEKRIAKLLRSDKFSAIETDKLLQAVLHYVRRYPIGDLLERAVVDRSNKTKGRIRALCVMVLSWCGKWPNSLSDDEISAMIGFADLKLVQLFDVNIDIHWLVHDCLLKDGKKALKRLERIRKARRWGNSIVENNLRSSLSQE